VAANGAIIGKVIYGVMWPNGPVCRGVTCPTGAGRRRRCSKGTGCRPDGTWAWLRVHLLALAEAESGIDWRAQVDSMIVRSHQTCGGTRKGPLRRNRKYRMALVAPAED
jgi:hypothetical protein